MGRLAASATVDDVLADLDADGYTIVERLIPAEAVAQKRAELERILAETPKGRNDFEGFETKRIYALLARTRAFDDACLHPLVLGVLDHILGHYQLSAPQAIQIGPGENAQPLHRDDSVYPVPRPHPELVVNTMWAIDDFTAENGATHVVPGSHRWVDRAPDATTPTVRATMPSGSVMFFVGSVFHGGGANVSDRPRLGVIIEYAVGWVRQQENQVLAVPPEVVRWLPRRLQELIGYNIYPAFLGNVDGQHPLKVLEREPVR